MEAVRPPVVTYCVDHEDRLFGFNNAWSGLATSNGDASLDGPRLVGGLLWDYLDEETAQIYRRMLQRVRDGAPAIRFEFRCDAPDMRRLIAMEISATNGGVVEFVITPLVEQERPTVPLLDPVQPRGEDFVLICAWCKQVELPSGAWVEVEAAVPALGLFECDAFPRLSHGICPNCSDDLMGLADGPPSDDGDVIRLGKLASTPDSGG